MKASEWIEEWLLLFPAEVKSGDESIRTKSKYCVNKLQKFCDTHKQYNKGIIFAATRRYLEDREREGWRFTRRATYFISKVGYESLLESYCERVTQPLPPLHDVPDYSPSDDFI